MIDLLRCIVDASIILLRPGRAKQGVARLLQSGLIVDGSKDTFFTKIDQLPLFNLTLIFSNEAGFASYRRLLGVKFITSGEVYSIQDMLTEQTISYMAMDFTPLMPLTLTNLFNPVDPTNPMTSRQKSPLDLFLHG